jgi:hypothetical protein
MNNKFKISSIQSLPISTVLLAAFMVFNLFVSSSVPGQRADEERDVDLFLENYSIHALPIPRNLNFAGEKVPLHKTYVRESYDRELLVNTYWQSSTLLLIKKANRYFPVIEPILKEEGVPDDFKYLPMIESGFQERAVSPAGAVGVWQFMAGAAGDYGLEVSKEIDERYHIEKATIAACRYLKKAYERFGSWTMAAASYNAGQRGMDRQIERQKTTNYYDLLLTEETGRYIFRLLAMKEIVSSPGDFGFKLEQNDLYPVIETDTLVVSEPIPDFADFAIANGTTYRELKDLNPWLRETSLSNPAGKSYTLKIPKPGAFEVKQ